MSAPFFPEQQIFARQLSTVSQVSLLVGMVVLFSIGGFLLPANGFSGFDWVHVFSQGTVPPFYPPWGALIVKLLTWPTLVGLTMGAVCLAVFKRAAHPVSLAFALLTLPLWWTLFLGQLEGVVTLGLLSLPWLVPLALVKPQISIFACGARRYYLLGTVTFLAASVLVWGPWPARMLATNQYYAEGRYATDISIGWFGAIVALPMLWYSRGDIDMLMLAGAFVTPHLLMYNMLPVVPAVARLRPRAAVVIGLASWLPFSANWLGPGGWWLGWIFIGLLWLCLAARRYPQTKVGRGLSAIGLVAWQA